MASCVYRSLRSVIHHLPIFAAAVRDRSTLTLDGSARTVWTTLNMNTPTVLLFPEVCASCPEHRPYIYCRQQQMQCREHKTTSQPRPTAQSSGQKHHARAVYCCGWLLYRRLRSFIRHHHPSLFCCAVHVRPVCRAPLKTKMWAFRDTVKWSRYRFLTEGASVILAEIRSIVFYFFQLSFRITYVTQTPQIANSTRAVQGACFNQLATTLYTPAARQQSRDQHHACAAICARCDAVATYSAFLSDPATCRAGRLCCCVVHACCHRYNSTTAAAAAMRFPWAAERGREFQPLLRRVLLYFCKYYLTAAVLLCSVCHTSVRGVCRVSRVECFQKNIYILCVGSPRLLCGRGFLRRERHNEDMHQHIDKCYTWYNV